MVSRRYTGYDHHVCKLAFVVEISFSTLEMSECASLKQLPTRWHCRWCEILVLLGKNRNVCWILTGERESHCTMHPSIRNQKSDLALVVHGWAYNVVWVSESHTHLWTGRTSLKMLSFLGWTHPYKQKQIQTLTKATISSMPRHTLRNHGMEIPWFQPPTQMGCEPKKDGRICFWQWVVSSLFHHPMCSILRYQACIAEAHKVLHWISSLLLPKKPSWTFSKTIMLQIPISWVIHKYKKDPRNDLRLMFEGSHFRFRHTGNCLLGGWFRSSTRQGGVHLGYSRSDPGICWGLKFQSFCFIDMNFMIVAGFIIISNLA